MAKKLFKKYDYEFDSGELKILNTFTKQMLNQMEGQDGAQQQIKNLQSLKAKLEAGEDVIRLTKAEKIILVNQLKENVKHLGNEMEKAWFIKKWMYKSLYNQYKAIVNNHFSEN